MQSLDWDGGKLSPDEIWPQTSLKSGNYVEMSKRLFSEKFLKSHGNCRESKCSLYLFNISLALKTKPES